jgi:hypothetical protein
MSASCDGTQEEASDLTASDSCRVLNPEEPDHEAAGKARLSEFPADDEYDDQV